MAFARAIPAQQVLNGVRPPRQRPAAWTAGAAWPRNKLRNLPAELWGAINALSYTIYPVPVSPVQLSHGRPFIATRAAALSTTAGEGRRADLDFRPSLSAWQQLSAAFISVAVCVGVYKLVPPAMAGWQLYLFLTGLLVGLWRILLVLRIEGKLQELAEEINGVVTAHDTPGFGLTQRPVGLDAYTSSYNGQLGREILDMQPTDLEDVAGDPKPKRVLIGHSMGGAAVVEEVLRRPEDVDCVVLVSPAVVAFSPSRPPPPHSDVAAAAAIPRWKRWSAMTGNIFSALGSSVVGVVLLMLQPLLIWVLRALVRSRTFWERGLRSAWYDSHGVTPELVDAYRTPQLVRGWETGILRFVRAKLTGAENVLSRLRGATEPAMLLTTAERFAAAVNQAGIRVLVVHGEEDLLVPISNSRRLAAMVGPNAQMVEAPQCGHQPQEEVPKDFVRWVADFLADTGRHNVAK